MPYAVAGLAYLNLDYYFEFEELVAGHVEYLDAGILREQGAVS